MNRNFINVGLVAIATAFTLSCTDDDDNNVQQRSEVYATGAGSGTVFVYDFAGAEVETSLLTTLSASNEGLAYDGARDELFVASKNLFTVSRYESIQASLTGTTTAITAAATSMDDLSNPRAVAINGNLVVVADSDDQIFYVYNRSGANLTLRNEVEVDFDVWGIEFIGNDLYAVVDNTSDLAVFTDFANMTTSGLMQPTKRITIEGIVRTHGIVYDSVDNTLIMTDVGLASSDSDGAFHVIPNFTAQFAVVANGGTLAVSNQTRVAGAATLMGNPVDVAYNTRTNTVLIAEARNGGGRVLAFTNIGAGGNLTPVVNNPLPGCNSIDFFGN